MASVAQWRRGTNRSIMPLARRCVHIQYFIDDRNLYFDMLICKSRRLCAAGRKHCLSLCRAVYAINGCILPSVPHSPESGSCRSKNRKRFPRIFNLSTLHPNRTSNLIMSIPAHFHNQSHHLDRVPPPPPPPPSKPAHFYSHSDHGCYSACAMKYHPDDYMKKQASIQPGMRSILVDWLIDVSSEFNLDEQTLQLGISLTDRFLSKMGCNKSKLQLVGTTALMIAS
ncbi:G2/mitotic-specific cyclin-A, partial [Trichinella spiralis]|uniref:G2/mitotic-specific cyclin-A n=1 Tax=Trichinella spiralis TaxID=6334 RepID=UPI0001EFDCA6